MSVFPSILLSLWFAVIIAVIILVIWLIVKAVKAIKAHFERVAHIESTLVAIREHLEQTSCERET